MRAKCLNRLKPRLRSRGFSRFWTDENFSHESHEFSLIFPPRPPRLRVKLFLKHGRVGNPPYDTLFSKE